MPGTQDDLFIIGKPISSDDLMTFPIGLNSENPILKGHFPGQPVVPGACILQLVKDALQVVLKQHVQLKKAGQLKFLRPVIPQDGLQLRLHISYKLGDDDDCYAVKASLMEGDVIYFKFQGSFADIRET